MCKVCNLYFRLLCVELDGIRPLLSAIRLTSNDDIILQAVRALVNISYYNPFTSGRILSSGGDAVLVDVLEVIKFIINSNF